MSATVATSIDRLMKCPRVVTTLEAIRFSPFYRCLPLLMPFYLFLLVVGSLACGSLPAPSVWLGSADPPSDIVRPLVATFGMMTGWGILCHVAARVTARQVVIDGMRPLVAARWFERQLDLFRWLGLGVVALCLAGFGFARSVESIPVVRDSMALKAMLLLSPGVTLCLSLWSAENLYGVLLGYAERSPLAHLREVWRAFRGAAAWLLVPVVVLLGVSDLVGLLPIFDAARGPVTAAVVLLSVPLAVPVFVRHLFRTGPLAPAEKDRVTRLFAAAGLPRIRAIRWDTSGRGYNAMVAGVVAPFRTVLISDRILDELPRPQMAMILLHEAAHVRRRHVAIRMLWLAPAWAAAVTVGRLAEGNEWGPTAATVTGIALTVLVLRWVAHRTELDADAHACRLAVRAAKSVDDVPASETAAAQALADALVRVTAECRAAQAASWMHPSLLTRLEALGVVPSGSDAVATESFAHRTAPVHGSGAVPHTLGS